MQVPPFLLRSLGRFFLPGGPKARLSILMYHDVLESPDYLRPGISTIQAFEQDMAVLARHFNVLSLDEAVDGLDRGTLPPRSVVISFDDGYLASVRNAVPILKRYGFSAIWYLVPSLIEGGQLWVDRATEAIRRLPAGDLDLTEFGLGRFEVIDDQSRKQLFARVEAAFYGRSQADQFAMADFLVDQVDGEVPELAMLNAEQVRELDASGMEIGSHTHSHPVLSQLADDQAESEIARGRDGLERLLGREVRHFAYPVGRPGKDFSGVHVDQAERLGMASAVTTGWGTATSATDRFQLPRFTPWDRDPLRYVLRMFWNGSRVTADIQARGA
ncbi:MAG: polysaccharide deacetylase family protein [Gammaproteobacteria bacterium]